MTSGALRIIDGDLFNICGRLKEIEHSYFVGYNVALHRFEVHNFGQRGDTLALVVPYPELDERTISLTLKTRSERKKQLLLEMEKDNILREKELVYKQIKAAEKGLENILRQ